VVTFLEESQVLDEGAQDADQVIELVRAGAPENEPYETEFLSENEREIVVRVIERKTGAASTYHLGRDMLVSSDYRAFVKAHQGLGELAGTPPFRVVLGKQEQQALSYEDLRKAVLKVAGEGVQLQRFKGLGEMNADQLFDTTMDASRRTLQRVTIEDASAADLIFSMLMGDKVEPRREFIEAHAREVINLDV
jgi:DNA gyrase subunit B